MKNYLILFRFTEQGIKNIKDSPNRVKNLKDKLKPWGIEVKAFYCLLGQYDTAWIVTAPDEQTIAKACLYIGSLGNVRTETFCAFTEEEYKEIIIQM